MARSNRHFPGGVAPARVAATPAGAVRKLRRRGRPGKARRGPGAGVRPGVRPVLRPVLRPGADGPGRGVAAAAVAAAVAVGVAVAAPVRVAGALPW